MAKRLMIFLSIVFAAEVLARVAYSPSAPFVESYLELSGEGVRSHHYWEFLTAPFLFAGILPLLFGLLTLWMFARDVEAMLGGRKFLAFFIASAVIGQSFWLALNFQAAGIRGATTAITAILIAFATIYRDRVILLVVIPFRAKWLGWLTLALNTYFAMVSRGADWATAHLGAIAFAYLYVKWLGFGEMPRWMAAVQRRVLGGQHQPPEEWDSFDSSRPGVAFNHPYRTETETETKPLTKKIFGWKAKDKPKNAKHSLSKEEFIESEVNPILEKISKQGMKSLTARERAILDEAGKRMSERLER